MLPCAKMHHLHNFHIDSTVLMLQVPFCICEHFCYIMQNLWTDQEGIPTIWALIQYKDVILPV